MKHSRDLRLNTGIELVKLMNNTDVTKVFVAASDYNFGQNYPKSIRVGWFSFQ